MVTADRSIVFELRSLEMIAMSLVCGSFDGSSLIL